MGRDAKPWYRAGKDAWYVEVDGKQVKLTKGKDARPQALAEFHRIMAGRTRTPAPARRAALTVGELIDLYTADVERRVGSGELSGYRLADVLRRLADFPAACGAMPADAIRPKDVNGWLEGKAAWNTTSRADAVVEIRGAFRWAKREGHIEANPLDALRPPPRHERREHVIDGDAAGLVVEQILSAEFRDLWCFLWWTGCRPKEARTLEAKHVDWDRGLVVLRDHKSFKRTRRERVIPLPWQAEFLLIRRAERFPDGPLFRNEDGRPWTKDSIHNQVWRLRERTGIEKGLVAVALRHIFGTALMERTGDVGLAATVLGHSSTAMLSRVYARLEGRTAHLHAAVDGLATTPIEPTSPGPSEPPDSTASPATDGPASADPPKPGPRRAKPTDKRTGRRR